MKNKKIVIIGSSSLALAMLLSLATPGAKKVSEASATEGITGKLIVDVNSCWDDEFKDYKASVYFFDDNNVHEAWSELISVAAPGRYIEVPYALEFTPTDFEIYRYKSDVEEEAWKADPKSSSLNIVGVDEFDSSYSNVVLDNNSYCSYRIPTMTHQDYVGDEFQGSVDINLDSINPNAAHHVEYMAQVELTKNDQILFEDSLIFFQDFHEANISLGDGIETGELTYVEGDSSVGYTCNSEGKYTVKYDLCANRMEISKEVKPVDPVDPVDPADPTDPVEPSGGDTPAPTPDPSTPLTIKNVIKAILKTFRDAIYDLISHIKGWFKR